MELRVLFQLTAPGFGSSLWEVKVGDILKQPPPTQRVSRITQCRQSLTETLIPGDSRLHQVDHHKGIELIITIFRREFTFCMG